MRLSSMKKEAWLLDDDLLLHGKIKRKRLFKYVFIPDNFGCGFSYQYVSRKDIGNILFHDDVHIVYSGYGHLERIY